MAKTNEESTKKTGSPEDNMENMSSNRATGKTVRQTHKYRLYNQTAWRIAIFDTGDKDKPSVKKLLPPFGEYKLDQANYEKLDIEKWKSLGGVREEILEDESDSAATFFAGLFGILFWTFVVWVVWRVFAKPPSVYWIIVLAFALLVLITFAIRIRRKKGLLQWPRYIMRWMIHSTSMLIVLGIAFGLPALVILHFGELKSPVDSQKQGQSASPNTESVKTDPNEQKAQVTSDLSLTSPSTDWFSHTITKYASKLQDFWSHFCQDLTSTFQEIKRADIHGLGRGLQFLFIGIFASLPALLFYLFDRNRLSTIRDEFYRAVLSLDPNLITYDEARSAYSMRVDEVLGKMATPILSERRGRLRRAKRLIVIIATLVITIGWILCLSPVGTRTNKEDLLSYFVPAPAPIVFAFLGAYVFAINWLRQLYVRSDLKPKAYAQICVRVITAIALGWAISAVPPSATASRQALLSDKASPISEDTLLTKGTSDQQSAQPSGGTKTQSPQNPKTGKALIEDTYEAWLHAGWKDYTLLLLAFNIGFFPPLGFAVIREFLRNRRSMKYLIPSLEEQLPLHELDGINLYHRARLLDEGIDNVENLAHTDLVELLLQTRFPLPTLVDWIDQAILRLHVRGTLDVSSAKAQNVPEGSTKGTTERKNETTCAIRHLQSYGIRTATDLMLAYKKAKDKNTFLSILGPQTEPKKLSVILDAIADDEWMQQLTYYRKVERLKPRTVYLEDFEQLLGVNR